MGKAALVTAVIALVIIALVFRVPQIRQLVVGA